MTARECNGEPARIVACEGPYPPTPNDLFEMFSDAAQYVSQNMTPDEILLAVSIDYGDEVTCLTLVVS